MPLKSYTIKVIRSLPQEVTLHIEGASSEEEARQRALEVATYQSEHSQGLPHVYHGGTKPQNVPIKGYISSVEQREYKPCNCTECSKEDQ